MSGWETKMITAAVHRLVELAAGDSCSREELRKLAHEILAAPEYPALKSGAAGSSPEADVPAPTSPGATPPGQAAGDAAHGSGSGSSAVPTGNTTAKREPLRELTLGRRPSPPGATASAAVVSSQVGSEKKELGQLEARCRAKSQVARWAAESQRRLWEGVEASHDDAPADPELVAWADQLVNGFYWLDDQAVSHPVELSMVDEVAGCFETVAEAIALIVDAGTNRNMIKRVMRMLAEAQSMLRVALRRLRVADDREQVAVYEWLRDSAARQRVYIERYMRADDLADPAHWAELLARIEATAGIGQQSLQQKARIDRLGELLKPVREGGGSEREWRAIIDAVEQLVGEGVPPSNREIRDLLLPVIDELPEGDDLPPNLRLVLREIDRYLATRSTSPKPTAPAQSQAAEVKEAARLLGGRSAVLIGGVRRPEAQTALARSLGLKELIWVETREHQSIETFAPVIARADVALVLLAIRWSSHSFGDVRQYCLQHGKPLVRLPGGYGPNQVAAQVLAQSSEWLGGG